MNARHNTRIHGETRDLEKQNDECIYLESDDVYIMFRVWVKIAHYERFYRS